MPIERVLFGGNDDRSEQRLALFVQQIRDLLNAVVTEDRYNFFYQEVLGEMRRAWISVSERVDPYSRRVANAQLHSLQEHGLTGAELDFKFSAINFIARRFYASLNAPTLVARYWFTRLLDVIDKLFRSLLAAVPGGGAIEEFKDICESLVPVEEGAL